MKTQLLDGGKAFIAHKLAGHSGSINCMYVEYGNKVDKVIHDVSQEYFDSLEKGGQKGYARVAITNISVEGNKITFFGMLTADDFIGEAPSKNSYLTTVTIASSKDDNRYNDTLIMSSVIGDNTKIIKGAYTTVCVSMEIGL